MKAAYCCLRDTRLARNVSTTRTRKRLPAGSDGDPYRGMHDASGIPETPVSRVHSNFPRDICRQSRLTVVDRRLKLAKHVTIQFQFHFYVDNPWTNRTRRNGTIWLPAWPLGSMAQALPASRVSSTDSKQARDPMIALLCMASDPEKGQQLRDCGFRLSEKIKIWINGGRRAGWLLGSRVAGKGVQTHSLSSEEAPP